MKLSTRARYALQCMIAIQQLAKDNHPVTIDQVAQKTQVSKRYLEQLAIALKNVSLLRSVSGRKGGYFLTRPAEEIKIGEIVETAIGQINIVDCVMHPEECDKSVSCRCRSLYHLINSGIRRVLYEHTLADMCEMDWTDKIGELAAVDRQNTDCGEAKKITA